MSPVTLKVYNRVIQFSTLFLTICLAWFAFIYYPKAINDYKIGNFPKKAVVAPVSATSKQFPIETSAYRIVYEVGSNTYYVFVAGNDLENYAVNRNGAKLALKSALSLDNLCSLTVLYSSSSGLQVPEQFRDNGDC